MALVIVSRNFVWVNVLKKTLQLLLSWSYLAVLVWVPGLGE